MFLAKESVVASALAASMIARLWFVVDGFCWAGTVATLQVTMVF